jgi:hypothetical protein
MTTYPAANRAIAKVWQARDVAGWLALAATPTYAIMAWIAANDAIPIALCASGSSLHRMTAMYVLMSLFSLAPWLKLGSVRRGARI